MEIESRRSVICHTKDYNSSSRKQTDNVFIAMSEGELTTAATTTNKKLNKFQQESEKDSGFEDSYEDEPVLECAKSSIAEETISDSEQMRRSRPLDEQRQKHSVYWHMLPLIPGAQLLQNNPETNLPATTPEASNLTRTRMGLRQKYQSLFSNDNPSIPRVQGKNFKRRYESSVLSALRDSQVRYLLSLYNFVDEGLLKNTLLKFLRASCLDDSMVLEANKFIQGSGPVSTPAAPKLLSKDEISAANVANSGNNNKRPLPMETSLELSTREEDEVSNASTEIDVGVYDFSISGGTVISASSMNNNNNINNKCTDSASSFLGNAFLLDRRNAMEEVLPLLSSVHKESAIQSDGTACTKCEYCQKTFSSHVSLERHMRTHEGKRTHKCNHCSRSFYDQSSYTRHMRSHNGEKKHKCDQCSMAFNKRSALEVHIRTHTGERPFVCEFCGKGFSISGNLHRHILIHTGHRPYKCGKCPRAFNNPSHLARHISSFHT